MRVRLHHLGGVLTGAGAARGPLRDWAELGLQRDVELIIETDDAAEEARRSGADSTDSVMPRQGRICWIGPASSPERPASDISVDLGGRLLGHGLVDAHTHAVFAGDRAGELMRRLAGERYQDIAASGGGILHTVRATREASVEALTTDLLRRLDEMAAWGARVVEIKTGYGLDLASELRSLDAIAAAAAARPGLTLVATAMPAHAVPPEFQGDVDGYMEHVCAELLPALLAHPAAPRFVDVFVERGYFDVSHAGRLWQAAQVAATRAGRRVGLKAHVDEFERVGGLPWALEAGATSVEHLLASDATELQALCHSGTVAVALPLVSVFLQQPFAAMRAIVDGGGLLAVATDCNPGSAMSTNLMLAAQLAVFGGRLTPAEALRAVTRGGAQALGCPEGIDGTLRVDGPACLCAFDVEHPDALFYELGAPPRAQAVP